MDMIKGFCVECKVTEAKKWRLGNKYCNACGIREAERLKKAGAASDACEGASGAGLDPRPSPCHPTRSFLPLYFRATLPSPLHAPSPSSLGRWEREAQDDGRGGHFGGEGGQGGVGSKGDGCGGAAGCGDDGEGGDGEGGLLRHGRGAQADGE